MAKKGPRGMHAFKCTVCNRQNYTSQKNKTNTPDKMTIKKYCKKCRQHTAHKESSKLK